MLTTDYVRAQTLLQLGLTAFEELGMQVALQVGAVSPNKQTVQVGGWTGSTAAVMPHIIEEGAAAFASLAAYDMNGDEVVQTPLPVKYSSVLWHGGVRIQDVIATAWGLMNSQAGPMAATLLAHGMMHPTLRLYSVGHIHADAASYIRAMQALNEDGVEGHQPPYFRFYRRHKSHLGHYWYSLEMGDVSGVFIEVIDQTGAAELADRFREVVPDAEIVTQVTSEPSLPLYTVFSTSQPGSTFQIRVRNQWYEPFGQAVAPTIDSPIGGSWY